MKLDDPYVCLEDIKNSPRYWKKKKYVMNAKLENLGAFNVFFTLSCADGRWPEVVGGILAERDMRLRCELSYVVIDMRSIKFLFGHQMGTCFLWMTSWRKNLLIPGMNSCGDQCSRQHVILTNAFANLYPRS